MRRHPMRWHAVNRHPMRRRAMRMSPMDVNHPYLSHAVRGWRRSLGSQSWKLAVSGLLPVEGGMLHTVCGTRSAVRAGGADGGSVKPPHAMIWNIRTRIGVRSVSHPAILEQVWIRVQALVSPGQTVAFTPSVFIRFDVPSLQDGTGTRGDGARTGVRKTLSWDGGGSRCGALSRAEGDSGGGRGHGVGGRGKCSLHGVVSGGTHGGLSQRVRPITTSMHHLAVHL